MILGRLVFPGRWIRTVCRCSRFPSPVSHDWTCRSMCTCTSRTICSSCARGRFVFGCSESGRASFPPPLRVFRIIMNEQKRKGRKKLHDAEFGEAAKLSVRATGTRWSPSFVKLLSNDIFFPCKCRSFIRKIGNGNKILDNPFPSPLIVDTFLPDPLLQRGLIGTNDKISGRLYPHAPIGN